MKNKKDDLAKVNYEVEYDEFYDDEDDDLYRPKKMNSVKSLSPLFIANILKNQTDKNHPMLQKDIIKILKERPYEVSIERKAVGRIVNALCDSGFGYVNEPKYGIYYDNEEARYHIF